MLTDEIMLTDAPWKSSESGCSDNLDWLDFNRTRRGIRMWLPLLGVSNLLDPPYAGFADGLALA